MRETPKLLISGTAASGTTVSVGLNIGQVYSFSVHVSGTGGTGSVVVQGSNDIVSEVSGTNPGANVVNWASVGTVASANPANAILAFTGQSFKWVRAQHITAGTASVTINFFAQGA